LARGYRVGPPLIIAKFDEDGIFVEQFDHRSNLPAHEPIRRDVSRQSDDVEELRCNFQLRSHGETYPRISFTTASRTCESTVGFNAPARAAINDSLAVNNLPGRA